MLLPAAHFVLMVVGEYRAVLNPDPTVWESDVASLELSESFSAAAKHPLIVLGGRQATLWRELERSLFPMPVVNRGIGAANIDDVLYYFDRLVAPYHPSAVLFVPSPTDFLVRDSKSPEEFMSMMTGLAGYVERLDGSPQLYVLTLNKWPRFPESWATVDRVNALLRDWAATAPRVTLIDSQLLFIQPSGEPMSATFRSDGVNLNEWGYAQLSLLLRQRMELDYPQFF